MEHRNFVKDNGANSRKGLNQPQEDHAHKAGLSDKNRPQFSHESSSPSGYNPSYRPNKEYSDDKNKSSAIRDGYQDTDEFEEEDVQREFVKRETSHGADIPADEFDEGQDYDLQPGFEQDGVRYTINTVNGNQEFIDEDGNRYIYHDITGGINTEMRAAQREQLRQEKLYHQAEQAMLKKQRQEERHRAKVEKIANKGNSRAFPYGTNY